MHHREAGEEESCLQRRCGAVRGEIGTLVGSRSGVDKECAPATSTRHIQRRRARRRRHGDEDGEVPRVSFRFVSFRFVSFRFDAGRPLVSGTTTINPALPSIQKRYSNWIQKRYSNFDFRSILVDSDKSLFFFHIQIKSLINLEIGTNEFYLGFLHVFLLLRNSYLRAL